MAKKTKFKKPTNSEDALKLFWREFAKIADQFIVNREGEIRIKRGKWAICPVCAVANAVKGYTPDEGWDLELYDAGPEIGLRRHTDVYEIGMAADYRAVSGSLPSGAYENRKKMFKLMGRTRGL